MMRFALVLVIILVAEVIFVYSINNGQFSSPINNGPNSNTRGRNSMNNQNNNNDSPVSGSSASRASRNKQEREQLYEAYNLLHTLAQVS